MEEASEYYSAGETAYKEKNYQKAFEKFTKAAELDNEEAQFHLAMIYHQGEGVEKITNAFSIGLINHTRKSLIIGINFS